MATILVRTLSAADVMFRSWAFVLACISVLGASIPARAEDPGGSFTRSLAGEWYFALDPLEQGVALGWHRPDADWEAAAPHPRQRRDAVSVPHSWSVEPRHEYTGAAWYRVSFFAPEKSEEAVHRIRFESVYQRCRVWLNGELAGEHEGGHIPFDFVVSDSVTAGAYNLLAIEVDNRWSRTTLPGARTGDLPERQVYPWWEYGGILGDVEYLVHGPVYHREVWVDAKPDLAAGDARVTATALVFNDSAEPRDSEVTWVIYNREGEEVARARGAIPALKPGEKRRVELTHDLAPDQVRLWSLDDPYLYRYEMSYRQPGHHSRFVDGDTFGIRRIEVRDAAFLLNGEPVRLAGATRARGNPRTGGYDSIAAVREDMELMKGAHFEMSRIHHYAPSRALLDWADENGFLIIAEPPVWGLRPDDLASTRVQEAFRHEMLGLMRLARSRPSVVAWALGNEYHSWTPQGVRFTRDMAEWVRSLDPTRPVTFVAHGSSMQRLDSQPEKHGFHYVDFLCVNSYHSQDQLEGLLDPLHESWPEKPVFVTEFGLRADFAEDEEERMRHFDRMLEIARKRPWVMGIAYWSFNDYRSRYPATNPDGFRHWGLVDFERRPRELYHHVAQALAPFRLSAERQGEGWLVKVRQETEIPRRNYAGLTLHLLDEEGAALEGSNPFTLKGGEAVEIVLGGGVASHVEVRYSDGRTAARRALSDFR